MTDSQVNPYLRDAVMTASQEQLQLMLYDGAIRFASQGRDAIRTGDFETSYEKLSRAQRIMLELQQGLNHEIAPELCDRMSGLYMFVYRKLVDGCVLRDVTAIDDALKILNYQRETWVMLIQRIHGDSQSGRSQPLADESGGESLSVEG